jgi:23S rRNA (cytidine1920-2'-O)/16S rRNA (cytidine1409-2'-O)-methyltransferase
LKLIKVSGDIVALVKPIFEMNFYNNQKLKVIKDSTILFKILRDLLKWCLENQIYPISIIKSPILGKGGSIEFLIHFKIQKKLYIKNYEDIIRSIL